MRVPTHMGLALTQMLENESGPMCVFLTFMWTRFLFDILNSNLEAHHQSRTLNWSKTQVFFIFTIYWFNEDISLNQNGVLFLQEILASWTKFELLLRARLGRGYITNKISRDVSFGVSPSHSSLWQCPGSIFNIRCTYLEKCLLVPQCTMGAL